MVMLYFGISPTGAIEQCCHTMKLDPIPGWVTNTFYDTDSEALKASEDPAHYTYNSSTKAWTYTPPSSAEQLTSAKTAQSALIEQSYASAMAAGVTSSADGTSRVYLVSAATITDVGIVAPRSQATYPANGVEAELIDGTFVPLSYSQMQAFSDDLQAFYLPLRSKRIQLLGKIKAIEPPQTVADVQAVVWS